MRFSVASAVGAIRRRRPHLRRISVVAGMGMLVAALTAAPAAARLHIGLASATPAKDSHVTTAPREIRLTFTGTIDVAKAGVELAGPGGAQVPLDSLRAVADSPRVAVAKVTGPLTAAGTYTVQWHAIAEDGAPGTGTFTFMYMPAAGR
jgi:methionine-rich copper-binding protein CopC